jgi:hypothetical protein
MFTNVDYEMFSISVTTIHNYTFIHIKWKIGKKFC